MIVARRRSEDFSPTVRRLLAVGTAWGMEQHGDEFGAFLEWALSDQDFVRGNLQVVEIGVRRGGTAAVWAKFPNVYRVVGVDLPAEAATLLRLHDALGGRFNAVMGDSHAEGTRDRVAALAHITSTGIDLLFLDGDHSAAGVQQDLDDYSPLVRAGGLIVLHDIVDTPHMRAAGHGVAEVWNRLVGEKTEFLLGDGEWGGIGVWRKP